MDPNSSSPAAFDPIHATPFHNSPSPVLQRGKACLSCRRRKMKCDGIRPVCTACLRGERAEDCEYTDGQHRSRTLTLEEDIARLRARVRELENPGEAAPSIELHAPYAPAGASAPSLPPYHNHAVLAQPHSNGFQSGEPQRLGFEAGVQFDAQHALSTIAPYAAELGFFLNIDRLRVHGTYILPALQSALALWSIRISCAHEPDHAHASERTQSVSSHLLSQAQAQLASALSTVDAEPDPAVFLHVVQTGILLAYYMQRIGQVVGAKYNASGTWALVTLLKLYQSPDLPASPGRDGEGHGYARGCASPFPFAFVGRARLPPPLDAIEAEERVRAFWTSYALDRWFCALGQGPCQSLATDGVVGNAMTVPWPDAGGSGGGAGGMYETRANVVRQFLANPDHDFSLDDPSAMHAKASVLLGEAVAIASSFVADHAVSQSTAFRTHFKMVDTHLQRCLNAAMMVVTAAHGSQGRGHALVTVHLLALAHVALHRPFISTHGPSRRRCVEGALCAVRVLDFMSELGAEVGTGVGMGLRTATSPIYAIVWTTLCLALHDEVLRLRALGPSAADTPLSRSSSPMSSPCSSASSSPGSSSWRHREKAEMIAAIRKLVGMLSALSQHCPSEFFAAKIEAVLPILESIAIS